MEHPVVCVLKFKDFVDYHQSSVWIKNLSGHSSSAGQGLVQWLLCDINGQECKILLPGCHVPHTLVHLLSPWSLFHAFGGECHQTVHKICVSLDNGIILVATYGCTNLSTLALSGHLLGIVYGSSALLSPLPIPLLCTVLAVSNQNLSFA